MQSYKTISIFRNFFTVNFIPMLILPDRMNIERRNEEHKLQLSGAFRFGTREIAQPGVGLAAGKVTEVVAVRVGLALEGYVHVGIVAVSILDKPDKPFDDIPDIKR